MNNTFLIRPTYINKNDKTWDRFKYKILEYGNEYTDLFEEWSKLMSEKSGIEFFSLNRIEGGICTGQSNQFELQIRIINDKYNSESIKIEFFDSVNLTKEWNEELIKYGYVSFAETIFHILNCKFEFKVISA